MLGLYLIGPGSAYAMPPRHDILEASGEPQVHAGPGVVTPENGPACFTPPTKLIGAGAAASPTIVPARLDAQDIRDLRRMLAGLSGRWSGQVRERVCQGTSDEPRAEIHRFATEAQAQWLERAMLRVEAELQDRRRGVRRMEVFWWLLKEARLRFGDRRVWIPDTPQWDVELLSARPEALVFMRKFRRRTNPRASVSVIEVRSLQAGYRRLRFREWFYVQGGLTRTRTWSLTRTR